MTGTCGLSIYAYRWGVLVDRLKEIRNPFDCEGSHLQILLRAVISLAIRREFHAVRMEGVVSV